LVSTKTTQLNASASTFTSGTVQSSVFDSTFFKLFQTKTVQTGVTLNKLFHCAAHV